MIGIDQLTEFVIRNVFVTKIAKISFSLYILLLYYYITTTTFRGEVSAFVNSLVGFKVLLNNSSFVGWGVTNLRILAFLPSIKQGYEFSTNFGVLASIKVGFTNFTNWLRLRLNTVKPSPLLRLADYWMCDVFVM